MMPHMVRLLWFFFLAWVFLAWFLTGVLHVPEGAAIWIALPLLIIWIIVKVASATGGGPQYVTTSAAWKCPYCLKRVKIGATSCHHCGRSVVVQKQQQQQTFAPVRPSGWGVVDQHGRWTYQCTTHEMAEREATRTGGTAIDRELDKAERKWAPTPSP
jgi:hypothetical protein